MIENYHHVLIIPLKVCQYCNTSLCSHILSWCLPLYRYSVLEKFQIYHLNLLRMANFFVDSHFYFSFNANQVLHVHFSSDCQYVFHYNDYDCQLMNKWKVYLFLMKIWTNQLHSFSVLILLTLNHSNSFLCQRVFWHLPQQIMLYCLAS